MKKILAWIVVSVILLSAVTVGATTALMYGDANGDGRITNRDIGLLQRYINGWDVQLGPTGGSTTATTVITTSTAATRPTGADLPEGEAISVEDANALGLAQDEDTYTEESYYVSGIIAEVYNPVYGYMVIADGSGNTLTIYGAYSADGEYTFDHLLVLPKVGDTVTLYGTIGCHNGTAQMPYAWIMQHNGKVPEVYKPSYNVQTTTVSEYWETTTVSEYWETTTNYTTGYTNNYTTNTTARPTTAAPTQAVDTRPTIKILSIGHSFSRDAMDTYMADLFEAAGYNATFGYLYYPGASLERQYHYVKEDSPSYEIYAKCVDGVWYRDYSVRATDALYDEDWDIVTFQPSPDYGKGTMSYHCSFGCNATIDNDYVHFNELVDCVRKYLLSSDNPWGRNTDVKFYWHLTWAFASDCQLWSFQYSNFDQMTMYQDFIDVTKNKVLKTKYIRGVIPCITSIQNVRTSWMGDTFNEPGGNANADGYHLNDKGDLVAAMTWVAYFTGQSAAEFKIDTRYTDAQYAAFVEAVDNAIANPWEVTTSSYTTEP